MDPNRSARRTSTRRISRAHQAPDRQWRAPAQVLSHWADASAVDLRLLRSKATGRWWDFLAESGVTVFVGREYEHLVIAISMWNGAPHVSYLPMPHPSGMVFDNARDTLHLASTRNPNLVFSLSPAASLLPLHGLTGASELATFRPLIPQSSAVYPGSLYLHDLGLIGGRLHGTAAGRNSIVDLGCSPGFEDVWWPRSVDHDGRPQADRNYLQLNSIAAGSTLPESYFTASAAFPSRRRPGQRNFPVDGRGVVFSGATSEPLTRGLTRPHSARFAAGSLLVANSGYGELVRSDLGGSDYETICQLPGWTRGLAIVGDTALVATSRVLPGYEQYAPGLDPTRAICGLHAISLSSGLNLGSMLWPSGNQIFAVEAVPRSRTHGFLHGAQRSGPRFDAALTLYAYAPAG